MPSVYVALEELPVTPNGKLDRQALPRPRQPRDRNFLNGQPQTSIEQTIAHIWQQLLHLQSVGIHDNFFDLGGHSLC